MATIIRGIHKQTKVRIADIDGEFAVLEDGRRMRLGMLEADDLERKIIEGLMEKGGTFTIHYNLEHFKATGRFKKHHWASARA